MILIYVCQIIAIQFAISLAKHNAPAVTQFENYGIGDTQMARFHRYNNWTKFFFCLSSSFIAYDNWWLMAIFGFLSFLWVWCLFDPALNLSRTPKRNFFYLGLNDADGRFWNGTFGRNSGVFKFAILLLLIIFINILVLLIK